MYMSKHNEILIVDDSRAVDCSAECGFDWSLAENRRLAEQQIKERFGGEVQLGYIDLSRPAADDATLEWQRNAEGMSLPLLVVNGKLRISGRFDIRMLMDVLEVAMEIEP
jgi:hypothetical protein